MEVFLLLLAIWGLYKLHRAETRHRGYMNSTPPRNLPIQYAYTIDEWYSLRKQFDRLIEPDWQAYRIGNINRNTYKVRCDQAVRQIIPAEYISKFQTLYRWGARAAAIRMANKGYEPGWIEFANYRRTELQNWTPDSYHPGAVYETAARNGWPKCIPGRNCFLDLYPDGHILEIMGCGTMVNNTWTAEKDPNAWCSNYYTALSLFEPERDKAISFYQQRGFDGHSYLGEERSFNGLSPEEIAKKYEFIILDPETGDVECTAKCRVIINPDIERKKAQQQLNNAMSEQARFAKIQQAMNT